MVDIESILLKEREMMRSILQQNSVKIEATTDYCPDCKHEEQVQSEYNNPTLTNQDIHTTQVESESEQEFVVESESESTVEPSTQNVNNQQQEQPQINGSVPLFF